LQPLRDNFYETPDDERPHPIEADPADVAEQRTDLGVVEDDDWHEPDQDN
jgi:hypothetical protein